MQVQTVETGTLEDYCVLSMLLDSVLTVCVVNLSSKFRKDFHFT